MRFHREALSLHEMIKIHIKMNEQVIENSLAHFLWTTANEREKSVLHAFAAGKTKRRSKNRYGSVSFEK